MIYILIIFFSLLIIYLNYDYLNILQQNHYKINLMKYYNHKYYRKFSLWLISFLIFNLFSMFAIINAILLEIFSICVLMYYVINRKKKILKLKITKRIGRIIIIFSSLYLIISLGLYKYPFLYFNVLLLIFPFINIIGMLIDKPFEKLINNKYLKNAKNILKNNPNLIKIAVTGSYGKTSTKNIIYQLLKDKYLTVATPKSYNTLLGVARTINEKIDSTTQIFITECGATSPGDIKEIAKLVKPDIAIITNIGPQHLESFKTIDNIVRTKFELIDALGYEDIAIINGDNEYLNNHKIENVKNIIKISLIDCNATYYTRINNLNPLEFTIYKNQIEELTLSTNLLGRHTAQNILFSYAVVDALKNKNIIIEKEKIIDIVKNLKPTPHRLEYKEINNIHLYDDSYNSNIIGFKNACEILKNETGRKIIITPGIVELGKKDQEISIELAKIIKDTFDDIYIIDNKASQNLIKYLNNSNLFIATSFKDAYNDCVNKYQNETEEIAILIENDLPDNYLER